MIHITEQYGMSVNYLVLKKEEYDTLEPFLRALGVRSRETMYWHEEGVAMVQIQAENVYKACISGHDKEFADGFMTDERLSEYQR